jgi:hypothetical protein
MAQKEFFIIAVLVLAGVLFLTGCTTTRETSPNPLITSNAGCPGGPGCPGNGPGNENGMTPAGTVTAPAGRTTVAGTGSGPCGNDLPTPASLEAARAGLAAGAASTDVSPGGCVRYTVASAGTETTEELLYNNKAAVRLTYNATGAVSERDADLDGFFEWRSVLVKGAGPDDDTLTDSTYDPATRALTRVRTYTRSGETVHVLLEEPDESGVLKEVWHYDISSRQSGGATPVSALFLPSLSLTGPITFDGCSAADETLIRQRLDEALGGDGTNPGGIACLARMGAADQMAAVTAAAMRPIDVFCDPDQDLMAYFDVSGWFDSTKRTELHINPDKFRKLDAHEQKHLLFHEMLHSYAEHETNPSDIPRVDETDPTEACAETCWGTTLTTKCSCATCLGTDICDPRCSGFRDCDPVLAFRCPCPFHPDFYASCGGCLAGCPSGLRCFGMSTCTPVSVECAGTKTTCP